MTVAVYVRVSSTQDTRSQEPDLTTWSRAQTDVVWYRDKATGTTLDRPGLERLLADARDGRRRLDGRPWLSPDAYRRVGLSSSVASRNGKEALIRRLHAEGKPIAGIARLVGLTRKTVYAAL